MFLPHYQKVLFLFLSPNQSGSIEGETGTGVQGYRRCPELGWVGPLQPWSRPTEDRAWLLAQGRSQCTRLFPESSTNTSHVMKNIHLYPLQSCISFVSLKKKKVSSMHGFLSVFKKEKNKGHFSSNTDVWLITFDKNAQDSDSRMGLGHLG